MNDHASLRRLFEQLDAWRHLPAYRLESRADAFFGLYMREVVQAKVGKELHEVIIPELPLRRGTLFGESVPGPNKSVKVDYALFTRARDAVYLVELKTDRLSRRVEQDEYLLDAQRVGLTGIIDGILRIVAATGSAYRAKYLHLLALLQQVGLVALPEGVLDAEASSLGSLLREVRATVSGDPPPVQVLYVQPLADESSLSIGFEEFGSALPEGDPVASVFKEYLVRWCRQAGEERPSPVSAARLR